MPLAGRLTAQLGSRAVTRVAGIAFPVMLSAVVLSPTALLMALSLLCFGIAGASMDVSMNAQGIAVEEQLGERTISRLHGMWSIGCFTGAAITSFMLSWHVPARPSCSASQRSSSCWSLRQRPIYLPVTRKVCTTSLIRCGHMGVFCSSGWWPSYPWFAKARSPIGADFTYEWYATRDMAFPGMDTLPSRR